MRIETYKRNEALLLSKRNDFLNVIKNLKVCFSLAEWL
jgi:hypothetical protein